MSGSVSAIRNAKALRQPSASKIPARKPRHQSRPGSRGHSIKLVTRRGEPIKNVTLITSNAAGQAQHVVGNYRPRSTLLLLSRLIGEKLAGTPYAEHFLVPASSDPGRSA